MNHKWKDNTCTNCGVKRIKRSWKLLMCIVNHPPWQVYKYGKSYWYYETKFKRPECKQP